ncbi:MAG: Hypothetical protein BHV28_06960 [Candidatus Tokpelaia hoelldobleri]|uniref:Uncharacterized protein n=1 Tax=Candidatus Tokpelaia hoelldobleri TaxID=1902579 RepID=A0A1U9JU63_9HYPH|nr:MAG: Hypothetical protein BHV28_06960 [Candidatus Tokpelaia hoelldoblerii]
MFMKSRFFAPLRLAATAALYSSAALSAAQAADMLYYAPPAIPYPVDQTCTNQHVLSRVSYYFYHQVRHVPGLPPVRIQGFSNIQNDHYEPPVNAYAIPRHYCTATAHMNDGSSYPLAYVVAHGQGFAGFGGINVDFCVEGFDKWRVHNYDCRTARWNYLVRHKRGPVHSSAY